MSGSWLFRIESQLNSLIFCLTETLPHLYNPCRGEQRREENHTTQRKVYELWSQRDPNLNPKGSPHPISDFLHFSEPRSHHLWNRCMNISPYNVSQQMSLPASLLWSTQNLRVSLLESADSGSLQGFKLSTLRQGFDAKGILILQGVSQALNVTLRATEQSPCPGPSWECWMRPFCSFGLKNDCVVPTRLKKHLPHKPTFCLRRSPSPRLQEETFQIVRNDASVCKMQICPWQKRSLYTHNPPLFCPSPQSLQALDFLQPEDFLTHTNGNFLIAFIRVFFFCPYYCLL